MGHTPETFRTTQYNFKSLTCYLLHCSTVWCDPCNDTFTIFEIQIWLPGFILDIYPERIFSDWLIWAQGTRYLGNKTMIYFFINWLAVEYSEIHVNRAREDWDKGQKYTCSYFTVVNVSFPCQTVQLIINSFARTLNSPACTLKHGHTQGTY